MLILGCDTEGVELLILSIMLADGEGIKDSEVVSTTAIIEETMTGVGVIDSAMVELGTMGVDEGRASGVEEIATVEEIAMVEEIATVEEIAMVELTSMASVDDARVVVEFKMMIEGVANSAVELANSTSDVISPDASKSLLSVTVSIVEVMSTTEVGATMTDELF